MTVLTTLPSKISKTKKRLSDESWTMAIVFTALIAVFGLFMFAMRPTILSSGYGIVRSEIPVVVLDQESHERLKKNVKVTDLDNHSPIVILTPQEFYFGTVQAFTQDLSNVRNKYIIPHIDGAPDMASLDRQMRQWRQQNHTSDELLVLLPTGNIPMPIVVQVLDGFRRISLYKKVILASGVL